MCLHGFNALTLVSITSITPYLRLVWTLNSTLSLSWFSQNINYCWLEYKICILTVYIITKE